MVVKQEVVTDDLHELVVEQQEPQLSNMTAPPAPEKQKSVTTSKSKRGPKGNK